MFGNAVYFALRSVDIKDQWGHDVPGLRSQPQQPTRHHPGDAGWDLYASRSLWIEAGAFADVHTDVVVVPPGDVWCRVVGRSSTSRKHGLLIQEGIIDSGYRGEMFFGVWNMNKHPFKVEVGMRLAQLIMIDHVREVTWIELPTDKIPPSARGTGGFGSTGT